jgi:hypothetical protein
MLRVERDGAQMELPVTLARGRSKAPVVIWVPA